MVWTIHLVGIPMERLGSEAGIQYSWSGPESFITIHFDRSIKNFELLQHCVFIMLRFVFSSSGFFSLYSTAPSTALVACWTTTTMTNTATVALEELPLPWSFFFSSPTWVNFTFRVLFAPCSRVARQLCWDRKISCFYSVYWDNRSYI